MQKYEKVVEIYHMVTKSTKKILILCFLCFSAVSFAVNAQTIEKRCKMTDTVFTNNCVLNTGQLSFCISTGSFRNECFSDETLLILDSLVTFLNDNTDIDLIVEMHTDSRGNDTVNLKLSRKKGEEIKTGIVRRGIDSSRITVKGFGEYQPAFVYLIDGKHYPYLENPPENLKIVELTEQYIGQFKMTDKAMFERLHQFNRRQIFRIVLKED